MRPAAEASSLCSWSATSRLRMPRASSSFWLWRVSSTYNDGVLESAEPLTVSAGPEATGMGNWLEEIWKRIVGAPAPAPQGTAGAQAEDLAARLLARDGLRLLARNVRCRGGEVDLIALEGKTVVCVEVRLRQRQDYGGAAASIGRAKRRRVILAARHWLAGAGRAWGGHPCRFDAVLFANLEPDGAPQWLRGAFTADH